MGGRLTVEAGLVGEVEDDEHAISLFEVVLGEGEELLLACGVPDADGDLVAIELYDFFVEADSEGGGVELREGGFVVEVLLYPSMKRRMRLVLPELGLPITIRSIFTLLASFIYTN